MSTKTGTQFDPHAEIRAYNKIVEDRGFSAFSNEFIDQWNGKYGHVSAGDIYNAANKATDAFMASLHDPNAANFEKNRNLFRNSFQADKQNVKNHHVNTLNQEYGRTFNGNAPYWKDLAYERRTLGFTNWTGLETSDHVNELTLLRNLMYAKWNAQGYANDDQEYVDRYKNEYCVALK